MKFVDTKQRNNLSVSHFLSASAVATKWANRCCYLLHFGSLYMDGKMKSFQVLHRCKWPWQYKAWFYVRDPIFLVVFGNLTLAKDKEDHGPSQEANNENSGSRTFGCLGILYCPKLDALIRKFEYENLKIRRRKSWAFYCTWSYV